MCICVCYHSVLPSLSSSCTGFPDVLWGQANYLRSHDLCTCCFLSLKHSPPDMCLWIFHLELCSNSKSLTKSFLVIDSQHGHHSCSWLDSSSLTSRHCTKCKYAAMHLVVCLSTQNVSTKKTWLILFTPASPAPDTIPGICLMNKRIHPSFKFSTQTQKDPKKYESQLCERHLTRCFEL